MVWGVSVHLFLACPEDLALGFVGRFGQAETRKLIPGPLGAEERGFAERLVTVQIQWRKTPVTYLVLGGGSTAKKLSFHANPARPKTSEG